ncbi:MAG: hypothetical protein PHT93_07945 [Massilibacteroides sp.]|nr:hypothetical protein [Massilibacteroides sp.]
MNCGVLFYPYDEKKRDQAKYPVVMVIIHRDTSILQTGILETNVVNSNFLLHFVLRFIE